MKIVAGQSVKFKHKAEDDPISVLLVDGNSSRASILRRALKEFGFLVVQQLDVVDALIVNVEQSAAELLVVGIDLPDDATLDALATLHRVNPMPVVMFAEKDTPSIIQKAVKAGISAFIVDDIQPQRLNSIVNVAMARFNETQNLRLELQQTKSKLAERKILERAKGMLMQQKGISEEEAYGCLRKISMDRGLPLAKVAENIIDVLQLFDKPALNKNA